MDLMANKILWKATEKDTFHAYLGDTNECYSFCVWCGSSPCTKQPAQNTAEAFQCYTSVDGMFGWCRLVTYTCCHVIVSYWLYYRGQGHCQHPDNNRWCHSRCSKLACRLTQRMDITVNTTKHIAILYKLLCKACFFLLFAIAAWKLYITICFMFLSVDFYFDHSMIPSQPNSRGIKL